jgi:hypothetical protein
MARYRFRNSKAIAPIAEGIFFPQREVMGLDARELTPVLVSRAVIASAHTRSLAKAGIVTRDVGGQRVPAKTIQRVVQDVGGELAERRDALGPGGSDLVKTSPNAPGLAVIECDGGRIRTRQPGHGAGVHLEWKGWNETQNACLIRAQRKTFTEDPRPDLPDCFLDAQHVAKIAETEAPSVAAPVPDEACVNEYRRTPRLRLSGRIGGRNDWCGRSWPAWLVRRSSVGKWPAKPNAASSTRPASKRSWETDCPGTGPSGTNTSPRPCRFSILFTCE